MLDVEEGTKGWVRSAVRPRTTRIMPEIVDCMQEVRARIRDAGDYGLGKPRGREDRVKTAGRNARGRGHNIRGADVAAATQAVQDRHIPDWAMTGLHGWVQVMLSRVLATRR